MIVKVDSEKLNYSVENKNFDICYFSDVDIISIHHTKTWVDGKKVREEILEAIKEIFKVYKFEEDKYDR